MALSSPLCCDVLNYKCMRWKFTTFAGWWGLFSHFLYLGGKIPSKDWILDFITEYCYALCIYDWLSSLCTALLISTVIIIWWYRYMSPWIYLVHVTPSRTSGRNVLCDLSLPRHPSRISNSLRCPPLNLKSHTVSAMFGLNDGASSEMYDTHTRISLITSLSFTLAIWHAFQWPVNNLYIQRFDRTKNRVWEVNVRAVCEKCDVPKPCHRISFACVLAPLILCQPWAFDRQMSTSAADIRGWDTTIKAELVFKIGRASCRERV